MLIWHRNIRPLLLKIWKVKLWVRYADSQGAGVIFTWWRTAKLPYKDYYSRSGRCYRLEPKASPNVITNGRLVGRFK